MRTISNRYKVRDDKGNTLEIIKFTLTATSHFTNQPGIKAASIKYELTDGTRVERINDTTFQTIGDPPLRSFFII